jgi:hypothetical protein
MLAIAFGAGSLLWAASAAAAPVVIHLIMRTKPRKTIFPALRFVQKTQRANLSKLRLKHLLLLLLRMLAIGLIALLLAEPFLRRFSAAPASQTPAAVAIVVDDSLSMEYRFKGRSLLRSSRDMLRKLVRGFPPGSRFVVIPASEPALAGGLTGARDYVLRRLGEIQPDGGQASLAGAISRAMGLLARSDLDSKHLYILSDMTRWSWRDVDLRAAPEDIRYVVLNARRGEGANFALAPLQLGATTVPIGQEVVLDAAATSTDAAGQVRLSARAGEKFLGEAQMSFTGGETKMFQATIEPIEPGPMQGQVVLEPDDAMPFDNTRYFTLEARPRPRLLVVRDAATIGKADPTTRGVMAAVAAAGSVEYKVTTNQGDRLDAEALRRVDMVLLSGVSALSQSQWEALLEHVEQGGVLWIVAGPLVSQAGYDVEEAKRLLPAPIEGIEALSPPQKWPDVDTDHPLLTPFAGGRNAGFDPVEFTRRLRLGPPAADTVVPARYADDEPGILLRTVGRGKALMWNFSPAPSFSNVARPATWMVMTARALTVLAGRGQLRTSYLLGETVTMRLPEDLAGVTAVALPGGDEDQRPLTVSPRSRTVTLTADRVGHWRVRFAGSNGSRVRGFSVNPEAGESDLRALTSEDLAARLAGRDLQVVRSPEELTDEGSSARTVDLVTAVLALLLVLMIGESFFANRFYRRVPMQDQPASPSRDSG